MSKAPPTKVLIVDDELDTVEIVQSMLQENGFEFSRAHDGDEALEVARRLKPDLIILDVMMPEQDGWLVCAKLKSVQPAPKILIFTVLRHGQSDRLANFVNADDIIHKPFTKEQLLAKVDALLAKSRYEPNS